MSIGIRRLALLLLLSPAVLHAQDEIVDRGNLAYQEGEYTAAIEAYEAVIEGGFSSAGLQYNLGNAYFKSGNLGRSILHWERALALSPGDPDTRANLELARSLTADAIEPMPTFWLFALTKGWVNLLSTTLLLIVVGLAWFTVTTGIVVRVLGRTDRMIALGRLSTMIGLPLLILFGATLLVRELGVGSADRGVVLVEMVPARSAPAEDDDLTLFEVHEGTRVRIDQRTGSWVEVVLDDGKVGWIPAEAMGII
ncbi:MAG: tetratricopeptide repeat protein [Longimicrobiales bacterium]|nr:tetratricopeptide repeat protein [Longimicrobiales bacterium]